MKNITESAPLLHIFLILQLVLVLVIFSFSLSFPVYKHHNNLFHSTYEFIAVVKSSRVAVFVIFNAIVMTIFFVSFRPSFREYDNYYCYIPVSNTPATYQAHDHLHRGANEHDYDDDDDYGTEDNLYGGNSDGYDEDDDDDGGDDSDDSLFGREEDHYGFDDEEKYIDLQRRSEEFIAENNRRWMEELRNERFLCIAAATEILTSSSS